METLRAPFQGVTNIIRFNWHFFVLAALACIALVVFLNFVDQRYVYMFLAFVIACTVIPLGVSYYIYDLSGLYKLRWLDDLDISEGNLTVNIHAGFDETSALLKNKYPQVILNVYDFYNPLKHTEISIKRARSIYPPFPGTVAVNTSSLPLTTLSVDYLFLIFSAHEIRDNNERIIFFKELKRVLNSKGKIVVVEHTRDVYNLLAYNIGFMHFLSRKIWQKTFSGAELKVISEEMLTPFVRKFVLQK